MPDGRKLYLDTFSEVFDLLEPWADDVFWDVDKLQIQPKAVYVLARQRFVEFSSLIRDYTNNFDAVFVMDNPHEGSETLKQHCKKYNVDDLVRAKKLLLIGGGDMQSDWHYLRYDKFLSVIFDYPENVEAAQYLPEIFNKTQKPYQFLFLNGRSRSHRRYLIEKFEKLGLLDNSLWTSLASTISVPSYDITLVENGVDRLFQPRENKILPEKYELENYRKFRHRFSAQGNIKLNLFDNQWAEIYLNPDVYIDTYFSVVTETVFDYPYSFRTEKIAKPLAIGHPFVVAANVGYYRDLKNQGFRTFSHLIDESFDQIENNQDRIDRLVEIVNDLCQQSLPEFIRSAQDVCIYNQQHLKEFSKQHRKEFPEKFFNFLRKYERP